MTATDRRDKYRGMFVSALERFKLGLEVEYDFTFGWGPIPDGSNRVVLAYWMFVTTPNPLLGQSPLGALVVMPDLSATQKQIDDAMMSSLGDLRQAKAKVLNGEKNG